MQRATYSADEEREAELLASLVLDRLAGNQANDVRKLGSENLGILRRLEGSLEGDPGAQR